MREYCIRSERACQNCLTMQAFPLATIRLPMLRKQSRRFATENSSCVPQEGNCCSRVRQALVARQSAIQRSRRNRVVKKDKQDRHLARVAADTYASVSRGTCGSMAPRFERGSLRVRDGTSVRARCSEPAFVQSSTCLTNPRCNATATACVRVRAPSLARIW